MTMRTRGLLLATPPRTIPVGQIDELRVRSDAHLLAITFPLSAWNDAKVTRYKSRDAMAAFCKDGSRHHALMKDPVHPSMMTNRNMQRATRTDSEIYA